MPHVTGSIPVFHPIRAFIAQLVEHTPDKGEVTGSNPVKRTNISRARVGGGEVQRKCLQSTKAASSNLARRSIL